MKTNQNSRKTDGNRFVNNQQNVNNGKNDEKQHKFAGTENTKNNKDAGATNQMNPKIVDPKFIAKADGTFTYKFANNKNGGVSKYQDSSYHNNNKQQQPSQDQEPEQEAQEQPDQYSNSNPGDVFSQDPIEPDLNDREINPEIESAIYPSSTSGENTEQQKVPANSPQVAASQPSAPASQPLKLLGEHQVVNKYVNSSNPFAQNEGKKFYYDYNGYL